MGRTPVKTRKGKGQAVKSSLQTLADESFARCPKGHQLPHRTDKGRCTPLSCAADGALERVRTDKEETVEGKIAKVVNDEKARTAIQASRAQVWREFMQIPVDLHGADAEEYFDREMTDLLPFALAKVKKDLFYGTEEQQERASDRVMRANGKSQRENPGNQTPSIVINMVNADGSKATATVAPPQLPWRKEKVLNPSPEAAVTEEKK
jgi:hypothetical protein